MKKCLTLLAATVLSGMTFASFAAQPNTSPATGQLHASGTVSATGASNLSDLEDKLAEGHPLLGLSEEANVHRSVLGDVLDPLPATTALGEGLLEGLQGPQLVAKCHCNTPSESIL